MKLRIKKIDVFIVVLSAIFLIAGIVTWASFGSIYGSAVRKNLRLIQHNDMSLGYSAYMMSHPQMKNTMSFYLFNVTNPDEVQYASAKPNVVEIGPFVVMESEEKKYLQWSDDKSQMFYQNYKKYIISQADSCADCDWEKNLVFPNPTGLGATTSMVDPQYAVSRTGKAIISVALMLLGEYPFVSQNIRELLFDGYNDALLSAAHSDFINILNGIFTGNGSIIPFPLPSMPRFGFFQGYNNSKDEEYWIKTGTEDVNRVGEVVSWAGLTELPQEWWTSPFARSIRGSDSGSFGPMHVDESTSIDFFFSFMCRSFSMKYFDVDTVHSIPAKTFSVPSDDFDTTADRNVGFRYKNVEARNYYPQWPNCPPKGDCRRFGSVNCSLAENLCHACCNGSYVDGTYLLPPGMFPLVCYPGKLEPTPFNVFYSPPHYLYSPPEVLESVNGMQPVADLHTPMIYKHEQYSGSVLEVYNRLQVNMPVLKSFDVEMSMNMPDVVVPLFWQESHIEFHDFVYNKIWLGFVLVPKLVRSLQFAAIGVGLFLLLLLVFVRLRSYRRAQKQPALNGAVINVDADADAADVSVSVDVAEGW